MDADDIVPLATIAGTMLGTLVSVWFGAREYAVHQARREAQKRNDELERLQLRQQRAMDTQNAMLIAAYGTLTPAPNQRPAWDRRRPSPPPPSPPPPPPPRREAPVEGERYLEL